MAASRAHGTGKRTGLFAPAMISCIANTPRTEDAADLPVQPILVVDVHGAVLRPRHVEGRRRERHVERIAVTKFH
jgi:hypothetical protein